jgi:hypothetical protein
MVLLLLSLLLLLSPFVILQAVAAHVSTRLSKTA